MIMAVFALLILTLLGLALTNVGTVDVRLTGNDQNSAEALYIADAGIAHAKAIVVTRGSTNFDQYLTAGNGTGCDGDELSDDALFTAPLSPADKITSAASGGHAFGAGRYEVKVCDDHTVESSTTDPPDLPDTDPSHDANRLIRIISTGFGSNGATAAIELIMADTSLPAIAVGSPLRISGNPTILGDKGGLHSNGGMDITGNPCLEQHVSSASSITVGGSLGTGSGCASSPPVGSDSPPDQRSAENPVALPTLLPSDFIGDADYILKADGSVEDGLGTVLKVPGPGPWEPTPGQKWDWDSSGQRWITATDSIPTGTYYSEVNISVPTSPGAGGPPIPLTLIAEGWVDIQGNPEMLSALTSGGKNYAVVAGYDLNIGGNPVNAYHGVFYAGHQIAFSGNPEIVGQVIGASQADLPFPNPGGTNLVLLDGDGFMIISGNATITYDEAGAIAQFSVGGWRECRGSDPANPCD